MKRIVTFGEILLRLSPADHYKFGQSPYLTYNYGGSEANVAVALAGYGLPVSFVSRIPVDDIGRTARKVLRGYGIDDNWLEEIANHPLGIYWMLPGHQSCDWDCLYARKGSVFSMLKSGDIDWEKVFDGASVFHFSGITPALTPTLRQICLQACQTAKKMGVMVSCDVNYRSRLWNKEDASQVMQSLCRYVDCLFINEKEVSLLIDEQISGDELMDEAAFAEVVAKLGKVYPDLKLISTVSRHRDTLGKLCIQAILWSNGRIYKSESYQIHEVVDSIGAGDAYAAAVLYGVECEYHKEYLVNFGAAAACLKHSCRGDFNLTPLLDIHELVGHRTPDSLKR